MKKVMIVSGSPFYQDGGSVWLPSIEWKSLKQWWEVLDEVVLLKPQVRDASCPSGWIELPENVKAHRLCWVGDSRLSRRKSTLKEASKILEESALLVVRMPYYESDWCYRIAKKIGMKHIVEIHGDWETAVLEEDSQSPFRKLTRSMRAAVNRRSVLEMTADALGALGVGPKLIDKYVPKSVPSVVSTNHLMDEDNYSFVEGKLPNDPPNILFVGDLQKRKGLHIFFESLHKLKERGNQFRVVMIGSGPMQEPLSRFAQEHGFSDRVEFTGRLAHGSQLYNFFIQSDLFVLPSVAAEGVPRVTHEAMAFGCPVIATDIGSVAWQLSDGAGVVVPPGDSEALANEINRVLSDKGLWEELRINGYKRSLEFTYEKQKERIGEFVRRFV